MTSGATVIASPRSALGQRGRLKEVLACHEQFQRIREGPAIWRRPVDAPDILKALEKRDKLWVEIDFGIKSGTAIRPAETNCYRNQNRETNRERDSDQNHDRSPRKSGAAHKDESGRGRLTSKLHRFSCTALIRQASHNGSRKLNSSFYGGSRTCRQGARLKPPVTSSRLGAAE
ncbi:hypothetical protein EVAR_53250_1 [Eumeta japonica]|uniref:Uncharacterized protein n=1 Tax=Eumeta variegata TaxID=151549 RepID=A0A4C1XGK4_EUMVA|nr:hypothetical protein EVAR_53250_1 [Eumeta japonica]